MNITKEEERKLIDEMNAMMDADADIIAEGEKAALEMGIDLEKVTEYQMTGKTDEEGMKSVEKFYDMMKKVF